MIMIEERSRELMDKYNKKYEEFKKYNNVVSNVNIVQSYLNNLDWRVKENSNMTFSLQGLNNFITSKVTKDFWLSTVYTKEIEKAHTSGDIHIHDLSMLSPYCVGWDLKELLIKGFQGVSGKVTSKPAKHFRAALGQVINFLYTLQGESAGAQAFSSFDTLLAPFIRYDNLNYDQVKQSLQEVVFNMNIPTRTGFQTPFTNLTFDLKCSPNYENEFVIIGGKPREETYKEFQKEMDILNKAFSEVMLEGDALGRVFSFPIPTYNITKDFDWDNENLDGIWKMTSKYGIPYFSNFVNSDMKPEDARSMCCRLRLDNKELNKRGGGLFGSNPLTGSLGVVTINLPRIGYLARSLDDFKSRLKQMINISAESLELKRHVIEDFTIKGLYPYSRFYLQSIYDRNKEYWSNHFSTIGIIGMNEAILNFCGKSITTEDGNKLALDLMDFMRNEIMQWQEKTGNLFNLEATPGEGTSYRMARLDKELYPSIITANNSNNKNSYYTNSTQLPVSYTTDLFHALDLQDELQSKYTGGTVFHIFLGESMPDINATKSLIKKITSNYKMPYVSLTPTFSICPIHGYLSGEHYYCPKCDGSSEQKSLEDFDYEIEDDLEVEHGKNEM